MSHGSALYYYGLCAERPPEVHVSVSLMPRGAFPEQGCILHHEQLRPECYVTKAGFNVSTPCCALLAMKPDLVLSRKWVETVRLAQHKHLIDNMMVEQLLPGMMSYAGSFSGVKVEKGIAMAASQIPSVSMPGLEAASSFPQRGTSQSTRFRRRGIMGSQSAFALVELLVVIAIIAILASFLLPVMKRAEGYARKSTCSNSMRQLGMASLFYGDGNHGILPTSANSSSSWHRSMAEYFPGDKAYFGATLSNSVYNHPVMICPTNKHSTKYCYAQPYGQMVNANSKAAGGGLTSMTRLSEVKYPSKTPFFLEVYGAPTQFRLTQWGTIDSYEIGLYYDVHDGFSNLVFVDGHMKCIPFTKLLNANANWSKYFALAIAKPDW